jgi:hypothetical protein
MIDEVLMYIKKEMQAYIGASDAEVFIEGLQALRHDNGTRGVYISLVNLEEEGTMKNTRHYIKQDNEVRYRQPSVFLNLYLLFTFYHTDYEKNLLQLSRTVEFFQSRPTFPNQHLVPGNAFPESVEKLVFDLYNLNLEQLNHLWGVLGSTYLPSVLYKVRLVEVQSDETQDVPSIQHIEMDTGPK